MAACRMTEIFHQHIPVLLNEVISNLVLYPHGIYVDGTFGRGSHSKAILNQLNDQGRLIAFDKDPEAVSFAQKHFSHDKRFTIIHGSYADMQKHLEQTGVHGRVNGVLFDLGVSSPQLDNPNRGFSFSRDGDLDMRMDTSQGITAKDWLAQIDEKSLADVLWRYGEEKCSRRIARAIIHARHEKPISTTTQLAGIIMRVLPKPKKTKHPIKFGHKHAATRSFQAIRIAINQELIELEKGLDQALSASAIGGRLLVISFHSLEDRLVKQFFRFGEKGQEPIRGLPIKSHEFKSRLKIIQRLIKPSTEEIDVNPRARSAILRIAEKQL